MKVKLSATFCFVILCMCNFAWKGRPRNDLYCVGRDVKPYSLTYSSGLLDNAIGAWNSLLSKLLCLKL